jgi:hypothetical protein
MLKQKKQMLVYMRREYWRCESLMRRVMIGSPANLASVVKFFHEERISDSVAFCTLLLPKMLNQMVCE